MYTWVRSSECKKEANIQPKIPQKRSLSKDIESADKQNIPRTLIHTEKVKPFEPKSTLLNASIFGQNIKPIKLPSDSMVTA